MKICASCRKRKGKNCFGKKKTTKDGLQPYCKSCRKIKTKKYRDSRTDEDRERISEYHRRYRELNKEKILKRKKEYGKEYRNVKKKEIYNYNREYRKKNRFKRILRKRVWAAFKESSWTKSENTENLLGCSFEFAKEYIENQFKDGMSWDNHGIMGWHIDHIIPLSSAKTKEEMINLCHISNLQPLWWHENLSKGADIIEV